MSLWTRQCNQKLAAVPTEISDVEESNEDRNLLSLIFAGSRRNRNNRYVPRTRFVRVSGPGFRDNCRYPDTRRFSIGQSFTIPCDSRSRPKDSVPTFPQSRCDTPCRTFSAADSNWMASEEAGCGRTSWFPSDLSKRSASL